MVGDGHTDVGENVVVFVLKKSDEPTGGRLVGLGLRCV
jgi:hypothetical protein